MKLKTKNLKSKKKKKGFTLIELVAVLAIIAILSAAFVPKVGNYITEAKKVAVLNEAKTVVTAYEGASYKIATTEADTDIEFLTDNGYLEEGSIQKISPNFSVADCKLLMDTQNNSFSFDEDGYAQFD